ncbi:MAG: DUF488 domain-containing protein [Bacteroidia bacterium]|nr:DUF488 domain-containing protein [Bacteroidia bacterium]
MVKILISNLVYTIGHSNHPIDYFRELLEVHSVNCVIDVRSLPASAYNPQFNKDSLSNYLKYNNITYLHFGSEFGARQTEKDLLDDFGKVDFDKVRKTNTFLLGVERLKEGLSKGFAISLMCSEADPFECHRFSLISYYLVRNGFVVRHILKDKSIIENSELEKRLLKKYDKKIPKPTLFDTKVLSEKEKLNLAYRFRNMEVAYDTLND